MPLSLHEFDNLITKRKMEDEDKIADLFNQNSEFIRAAWGDCNMATLAKGDVLQLERKGYWIVDVPAGADGSPAVLLNIPDGREKEDKTAAAGKTGAEKDAEKKALDKKAKEDKKAKDRAASAAAAAAAGVAKLAV